MQRKDVHCARRAINTAHTHDTRHTHIDMDVDMDFGCRPSRSLCCILFFIFIFIVIIMHGVNERGLAQSQGRLD